MSKIKINTARCKGCGYCVNDCPRKALSFSGNINDKGYDTVQVDDSLCVACGGGRSGSCPRGGCRAFLPSGTAG